MAARPPAVGVAKVTWTFLCSGKNFTDSFYLSKVTPTPWTVTELNTVANAAAGRWNIVLAPVWSSSCSLVLTTALDLSDDTGREGTYTSAFAGAVTASPPLPLNAVAKLTFGIARRYRGGRPGISLSGRVQSDLADERVFNDADADTLLNNFVQVVDDVLTHCPAGSFQCAVSYVLDGVERAIPLVLPIISWEIQKRLCTLRKRLGKSVAELFG